MGFLAALVAQLLHAALLLAAAPLLLGVLGWLRARLLGRLGPPPLQPWRDMRKLLRKRPVLAETASAVTPAAPALAAAATFAALLLVPSFAQGMLLAPLADVLVIAGLLALARAAQLLAALDAGGAFGGLGAARALALAAFAEPALLLAFLALALLAGGTNLDAIGALLAEGTPGLRVPLLFVLLALAAVALAECARMPVDDPATPSEPAMLRGAMIFEASGRHLALWQAQAALKLTFWLALLAALFLPFGTAPAGAGPLAWALGILAFALKLAALALALAAFESAIARLRLFRLPEFLGAALVLALLAAAMLLVSTGLA